MDWEDRVACKIITQQIGHMIAEEYGDLANVMGIMGLVPSDRDRLVKALKRIQKRFDKAADLPSRRVEWRNLFERGNHNVKDN